MKAAKEPIKLCTQRRWYFMRWWGIANEVQTLDLKSNRKGEKHFEVRVISWNAQPKTDMQAGGKKKEINLAVLSREKQGVP